MTSEPSEARSAEIEQAFFDRFVAEHGDPSPFKDRGWQTLARRYRQCTHLAPRDEFISRSEMSTLGDLLEVGCGLGQSRQIYAGTYGRYTGVDLSPATIAAARERYPADDWRVADARHLPFPEGRFDVVAFSSVLHHIPDFATAIREAYCVLKPGGKVFAFDPNVLHPAMALFRHPRSPLYLSQGVSPNERPLLPGTLRKEFVQAGFVDVRTRCQSDIPYRQVAPKLLNAILGLYNCADWLWETIGLARWFGTFVLTCATKPTGETLR